MKRVPTGVAYSQAQDCFTVPTPDSREVIALARGADVRTKLDGLLPRNGSHLRDVVMSVAIAFRAAR